MSKPRRLRAVKDMYRARMTAIAKQIDGEPGAALQAAVRRVVELHILGERLRAKLLQSDGDASSDALVRAENMIGRAERQVAELIERAPKPRPFWQRIHDEEEADDGEED